MKDVPLPTEVIQKRVEELTIDMNQAKQIENKFKDPRTKLALVRLYNLLADSRKHLHQEVLK